MFDGWKVNKWRGRINSEKGPKELVVSASSRSRAVVTVKIQVGEKCVAMADNVIEESDNYVGKDELNWGYEEGKTTVW